MEIEIKKYVLEQLNGQCIRRKRIDVLEFELETLMSQACLLYTSGGDEPAVYGRQWHE